MPTLALPPRDAPALKTGKAPPTVDARDALFTEFATVSKLPKLPAEFGHQDVIPEKHLGMLGNGPDDTVAPGFGGAGDCVWAGGDHETMLLRALGKKRAAKFTGAEAIHDYSAATGYVIGDDRTDQGTNVRDALNYRRRTGLIDHAGHRHKIGAFVQLEPGNTDHVKASTYLLDVTGIGFEFPETAMSQFNQGKPWTVVAGAQVDGGHYVPVVAITLAGVIVISWGRYVLMTWPFFRKYVDEAWGILSTEMLKSGKSPEGFDLPGLTDYLGLLGTRR